MGFREGKPVVSSIPESKQNNSATSLSTSNEHDFTLSSEPSKRVDAFIIGPTGCGKTSFVVRYCPDPIGIIYLDGRSEAAIKEAKTLGRTIYDLNLQFNKLDITSDAERKSLGRATIDKLFKNIKWLVRQSQSKKINTICIDGGTECDKLFNISFDGKEEERKQIFGKDWDYIDSKWRQIFELVSLGNAHFIVTARAKEIFKKNFQTDRDEGTGEYWIKARDVVAESCQWGAYMSINPKANPVIGLGLKKKKEGKEPTPIDVESMIEMKVIKAGRNLAEYGKVYDKSNWNESGPFAFISHRQNMELFPGSTPDDWRK